MNDKSPKMTSSSLRRISTLIASARDQNHSETGGGESLSNAAEDGRASSSTSPARLLCPACQGLDIIKNKNKPEMTHEHVAHLVYQIRLGRVPEAVYLPPINEVCSAVCYFEWEFSEKSLSAALDTKAHDRIHKILTPYKLFIMLVDYLNWLRNTLHLWRRGGPGGATFSPDRQLDTNYHPLERLASMVALEDLGPSFFARGCYNPVFSTIKSIRDNCLQGKFNQDLGQLEMRATKSAFTYETFSEFNPDWVDYESDGTVWEKMSPLRLASLCSYEGLGELYRPEYSVSPRYGFTPGVAVCAGIMTQLRYGRLNSWFRRHEAPEIYDETLSTDYELKGDFFDKYGFGYRLVKDGIRCQSGEFNVLEALENPIDRQSVLDTIYAGYDRRRDADTTQASQSDILPITPEIIGLAEIIVNYVSAQSHPHCVNDHMTLTKDFSQMACASVLGSARRDEQFSELPKLTSVTILRVANLPLGELLAEGVDGTDPAKLNIGAPRKETIDQASAAEASEQAESLNDSVIVIRSVGMSDNEDGFTATEKRVNKGVYNAVGKAFPLHRLEDVSVFRRSLLTAFPHCAELIEELSLEIAENDGIGFQPLMIAGPPGCGKTEFARRVMAEFAMDPMVLDAGAADRMFGGLSRGYSASIPSYPLMCILDSGRANPIIIADEIDKAPSSRWNGNIHEAMLPMVDRSSSRSFVDPHVLAPVDISHVNWIAIGNDIRLIPSVLTQRFQKHLIPMPSLDHMPNILRESAKLAIREDRLLSRANGADARFALTENEIDAILEQWKRTPVRRRSLRGIQKMVKVTLRSRDRSGPVH